MGEGDSQPLQLSSNVEGSSQAQGMSSLHLPPHLPQGEAGPRRPTHGVGVQAPPHVPTLRDLLILDRRRQAQSPLKTQRLAEITTKMMTATTMMKMTKTVVVVAFITTATNQDRHSCVRMGRIRCMSLKSKLEKAERR